MSQLCEVLALNSSSYYYRQAHPCKPSPEQLRLESAVKALAQESHHTYGSRRMAHALSAQGYAVGRYRARRLMQATQLKARYPQKHHRYPKADSVTPVENVLNRQFTTTRPNQVWVGDVTYIATAQGFRYLAVVMDLYGRHVIGYALSDSPDTQLTLAALQQALQRRKIPKGGTPQLIFHSDQGCHYIANQRPK